MWSNIKLLSNLSEVSWQNFQKTLPDLLHVRRRGFPVDLLPQEAVLWVVLQHGPQSLYKVAHVLVNMGQSGLAQELIHSDAEDRGFLWGRDIHDWYKIISILADREVFLDTTAHELSYIEMSHFEWFVQFTCLEEGVSWIDLECERQSQEFEMMASACTPLTAKEACAALLRAVVVKHGQDAAGFMKRVFKNMDRDDFTIDLYYTVKKQFEIGRELNKKIEQMELVIIGLMNTFGTLNTSELMDLKHALAREEQCTIPWYRLCHYETSHLVFYIVQTYGQRSVEITKNLLKSIGRIDRLTWQDLLSCDYSPYHWRYALLINKVATVATVTELLGKTLSRLRSEDLQRFKKLLVLETLFHPAPHVDVRLLTCAKAEQTGALLLHTYGQKAIKTTYWILKKMRRSNVAHSLQSLRPLSMGEPSKPKVATVKYLRNILFNSLAPLSHKEMYEFKMLLQLRYCRMDHAWIQEREADADGLVDLILETSGQCCLQVITDVLKQMGKSDLVIDSLEGTDLAWSLDYTDSYTYIDKSLLKENPKATADVEKFQVVLQELTDKQEMQAFKKHLQIYCESNLSKRFVWNYIRIFSDPQDLVDLLVAVYGEFSSAGIIQTVLSDMKRQDLTAKTSKLSVTSEGLGQSVEPDSWISAKDIWTKLEPKEMYSQFTYSLQSGEGHYECSVSGLRWSCEQSVSFQYRFVSWEEHLERVKALQYMPAGPLIDLTVSSGRLDVVYLPHWLCVDNPDTEERVAVLHINDSGDTLEKATKVTSSHVELLEPIFSPRAVLIKLGFPVKIYCSLLIYKTNTAFLTLHVYLIPRDPGLKESMDRSKQHHGYSIIPKPHPDRSLKISDRFVLKSHQETLEITPQKLTLRYQIPPNFYEVYTKNPDFDFNLELAQHNDCAPVWSCTVRQGEYTERTLAVPRPEGIHFVDKFERQLIQRVSNIAEILDHLRSAGVVSPEDRDTISVLSTSQQKMRQLFRGALKSSGEKGKDIFYRILKDKEPYLCAELEGL